MNPNKPRPLSSAKPWSIQLDDEVKEWDDCSCEATFATLLTRLFTSPEQSIVDTARQIDTYHETQFLPADPLLKYEPDKGMEMVLSGFYRIVFTFARFLPFDDAAQDKLILLLLELRRLPPKHFRIWDVSMVVA